RRGGVAAPCPPGLLAPRRDRAQLPDPRGATARARDHQLQRGLRQPGSVAPLPHVPQPLHLSTPVLDGLPAGQRTLRRRGACGGGAGERRPGQRLPPLPGARPAAQCRRSAAHRALLAPAPPPPVAPPHLSLPPPPPPRPPP